jgi:hypothetical protein
MSRSNTSLLNGVKLGVKKIIGFAIVVLILAFIGYHLYSVATLAKNFKKSTGISTSESARK